MITQRRLWNKCNGPNTLLDVIDRITQEDKKSAQKAGFDLEEAKYKFNNANEDLENRLSLCKGIYESYVKASLEYFEKSKQNVIDVCEKYKGIFNGESSEVISEAHKKYDENVKAILSRIDAHDSHNNCIECINFENEDNLPECYLNYIDAANEDIFCASLVNEELEAFSETINSIYNKVQKAQVIYTNAFNKLEKAKKVCEKFEQN
jgi:hypothetical protein